MSAFVLLCRNVGTRHGVQDICKADKGNSASKADDGIFVVILFIEPPPDISSEVPVNIQHIILWNLRYTPVTSF